MHQRRKAKAVAMRAERDSCYQPSFVAALVALALALLLAWHGMARAEDFTVAPPTAAQLPDAVQGPGADRIPPGLACSDAMDFAPEANQPSPFDADTVAWRAARAKASARLRISDNDGCPALRQKAEQKLVTV